ncbi:superfamily I DNA/RNA helicase [Conyzicola lurida]|uniref:DNA 3'-5' helicase n=1 Tax=Conyzicola lurida TaxID=1172621 RepID=A0A841ATD0_9MICO|nr:superfamily I DNA/RNA helicase [Conyzicola lurida]
MENDMRLLPQVPPTAEQLALLTENKPGVLLIKGAAGSGKTTTALLRLRQLCAFWVNRKARLDLPGPVRVLVLTFNTTLKGYIEALAQEQIKELEGLELRVVTFAKFARDLASETVALEPDYCEALLRGLCRKFGGDLDFVKDEVEYVLSRLEPEKLEDYIGLRRIGRGQSPRMEAATRRRLLDEVIYPYRDRKAEFGWSDWNDLAIAAGKISADPWDVVVIDETQDFSANQLRTVMAHVADDHQVTFVMDAAQQIYPRGFTWREANAAPGTTRTLKTNYRNTREIAAFARPFVEGLEIGDDGELPDFSAATRTGPLPTVLTGLYNGQLDWAIENVVKPAVAANESVAFLKPRGGRWFDTVRTRLDTELIAWVELTQKSTWPGGDENVAVSTLHSAKGLEFDHVILLGLNQQVTPHGEEAGDSQFESLRRLVAMGLGRARTSVTIGYKKSEASSVVTLMNDGTYTKVSV